MSNSRLALKNSDKRPTLKTISEITGLAVTTVSRALKNGSELSVETRARVQQVAKEVGYKPNRAGIRLRTGQTYVIGLILNQSDEIAEFARRMIMGISNALRNTPYHLVVIPQFIDSDPLEPIRYVLDSGAADGIIFTHTQEHDERVKLLMEQKFPFVTHGRTKTVNPHPFHDFDNHAFTYQATKKLLERGRKKILLIKPPHNFTYQEYQIKGFMQAINETEAQAIIPEQVTLDSTPDELRNFIKTLAANNDLPDGLVCGSEGRSLAITAGLQDAGIKIGIDIDVITKETSDLLDHIFPQIDSFAEDLVAAGNELTSLLLRSINGESPEQLQTLAQPIARKRVTVMV